MKTAICLLCCLAAIAPAAESRVTVVPINAKLAEPFGVDFDQFGAMFVIEHGGHRLIKVKDGRAEVVAGNGQKGFGGDGGPARQSQLNSPHNIAVGPGGDIYIADTNNCRVRNIDAKSGVINTFAGTGKKGFGGDGGAASAADFGNIYCVAFDPKFEHMYLADLDNRRVRAIDMKSGIVSTVAGNGKKGVPADGADAKDQPLVDPRAVAADGEGNVYVLERSGHALRVVDASGKIRRVAGTGKAGYSGDGGPAREAMMNGPKHLVVAKSGDVLIADTENHVIRRYRVREGTIELLAGTGKSGSIERQLARPHGVLERSDGKIFIADSENHRILQVEAK
jgi:sugar lactone lactonase YvrE